MSIQWRRYDLTEEAVDQISEWVQETCDRHGVQKREKQRIRLSVEEVLLRIRKHGGEETVSVEAGIGARLGRQVLLLRYAGGACDPTDYDEDDWASRIRGNLGISPVYSRRGDSNRVSFTLTQRAKLGGTGSILAAAAAAAALGLLGPLLPEALRTGLDSMLLSPLTNAFLGLLNTFAELMIAFAICSGILGMGDSSTLAKTGKTFLIQIVLLCTAASALAALLAAPALRPEMSAAAQSHFTQAGKIGEMLFAILPSDPVTPFLSGNTLQIIVIAMFLGAGLLALGERARHIRDIVEEGTQLFAQMMMAVCRLIPLYVFTALLRQFWSGGAREILSVWKPVALIAGISVLFLLLMLLFTAWQTRCPASLLLHKLAPPCLVAFTTCSSIAAFQPSMDAGRDELGIDPAFLRFAFPIGSVMYMPMVSLGLVVMSVHFAREYGVAVNLSWFIMAVVTASLLAIAIPPLPGAGLMIFSTLFAQLGIPAEALLLAALMNVMLDYIITGGNNAALLLELTREAEHLHMLDRTVLLKRGNET
ncbi:MAG: cation:dicarboxylase symporter family transporter [Ruminococcaceae bacterium]|nr:cation:dicarboxylase symporter family transporter [Oscillospiraceae bacterium]